MIYTLETISIPLIVKYHTSIGRMAFSQGCAVLSWFEEWFTALVCDELSIAARTISGIPADRTKPARDFPDQLHEEGRVTLLWRGEPPSIYHLFGEAAITRHMELAEIPFPYPFLQTPQIVAAPPALIQPRRVHCYMLLWRSTFFLNRESTLPLSSSSQP